MLLNLLLVVPLVLGDGTQFSFPGTTLEINDRFTIPINTCFQNATRYSAGGSWRDEGSTYCTCTEGSTETESGFACFYYEETDCTGRLYTEEHWGGCEDSGFDKYLYTVENCKAAQTYLKGDDPACPYWIRDGTISQTQRKIMPIDTCVDYWCANTNDGDTSRSCTYECETDDIKEVEHTDYECVTEVDTTDYAYSNRQCSLPSTGSPDCSVTVTQWVTSSNDFECGSKSGKNHFKTSRKSNPKSRYIMLGNDEVPYPISECATVRNGYYSYSYQYVCIGDESPYVELRHYLNDDGDCNEKGTVVVVDTYNSENTTFVCDGSNSTGRIGYYDLCDSLNWDATYYEYLTLFGECIPLKDNPSTKAGDDNVLGDQPWYSNLRVVMSCNLNERGKSYPSVYLYVTEDCTGDYLFSWDWDDYYNYLSNYGIEKCSVPQIKGCSNGKDSVRRGNLPTKESVC